jgi:hypothetical protein
MPGQNILGYEALSETDGEGVKEDCQTVIQSHDPQQDRGEWAFGPVFMDDSQSGCWSGSRGNRPYHERHWEKDLQKCVGIHASTADQREDECNKGCGEHESSQTLDESDPQDLLSDSLQLSQRQTPSDRECDNSQSDVCDQFQIFFHQFFMENSETGRAEKHAGYQVTAYTGGFKKIRNSPAYIPTQQEKRNMKQGV